MTYALTLVKGIPQKREKTLSLLTKIKSDSQFKEKNGVEIKDIFISFGWPDIVLLIKGNNVELLKSSIVELRDIVAKSVFMYDNPIKGMWDERIMVKNPTPVSATPPAPAAEDSSDPKISDGICEFIVYANRTMIKGLISLTTANANFVGEVK